MVPTCCLLIIYILTQSFGLLLSFLSTASSPSLSLRFSLTVTTTWSAASTLLRRSWLLSTRPCLTTTSTWKALCSSPTWLLPDTPAHTSTATKRLPWQLLRPCAVLCPLQCLVSWMPQILSCWHAHIFKLWILHWTACMTFTQVSREVHCSTLVFFMYRHYLPVWWPEWGGSLCQPERHEPVPTAQALGPDLFIRSCFAGLCPQSLGRQEGEWKGMPGGVCQESSGMCEHEWKYFTFSKEFKCIILLHWYCDVVCFRELCIILLSTG